MVRVLGFKGFKLACALRGPFEGLWFQVSDFEIWAQKSALQCAHSFVEASLHVAGDLGQLHPVFP